VDEGDPVTPGGIRLNPAALSWRFSRSSAPGGQHVNTSSTKADLRCDLLVADLPEPVRDRIIERLGVEVRVVSSAGRSQLRNRADAMRRLAEQLDEAAKPPPRKRRATRPGRGAVERRLADKQRAAGRKAERRWKPDD
jgi:ribosome-associated protein